MRVEEQSDRTVKGEAGFAITPVGRVPSDTCTWPERPFRGVTLTLMALLVLPCATATVAGERFKAKSGEAGEGGCTSA